MTGDAWGLWGFVLAAGFLTALFSVPTFFINFLQFIGTFSIGIFLIALSYHAKTRRQGLSP
ncbi:MAG: hypothetical protein ACE5IJ_07315 [Thermoplasmata archaeon]